MFYFSFLHIFPCFYKFKTCALLPDFLHCDFIVSFCSWTMISNFLLPMKIALDFFCQIFQCWQNGALLCQLTLRFYNIRALSKSSLPCPCQSLFTFVKWFILYVQFFFFFLNMCWNNFSRFCSLGASQLDLDYLIRIFTR